MIHRSTSARYRDKGIEIRRIHRECHHSGRGVGTLVIRHRQREDMSHGRSRRDVSVSVVKLVTSAAGASGATELSPVPPVLAQA